MCNAVFSLMAVGSSSTFVANDSNRWWHCRSDNGQKCGIAVGISAICHSIPDIQCTSGWQYAILDCTSRPTSREVRSITIDSGMVKNVGIAVEISALCQSFQRYSVFPVYSPPFRISLVGRRRTLSAELPLVRAKSKLGVAVGISAICCSIPEILYTCSFGLQPTILNAGSRLTSCSVKQNVQTFVPTSGHASRDRK
jgi:hypothetical protein